MAVAGKLLEPYSIHWASKSWLKELNTYSKAMDLVDIWHFGSFTAAVWHVQVHELSHDTLRPSPNEAGHLVAFLTCCESCMVCLIASYTGYRMLQAIAVAGHVYSISV